MLGGAWLSAWVTPPRWVLVPLLALIAILFVLAARRRHDPRYAAPWFTAALLLLLAAAAVITSGLGRADCQLPEHGADSYRVMWEFSEKPRTGADGALKGRAEIQQYWRHGAWHACPIDVYATSTVPLPPGVAGYESLMRLEATGARTGIRYFASINTASRGHGSAPNGPGERLKQSFELATQPLPEPARALLPGMLYGDRSLQDDALNTAMKQTGLSHLTAVSGSNCAIIAGLVLLLLRGFGTPRWLALLGLGAALVLFAGFVGPEPSVLRAAVMGAIAALSLHFGRGRGSLGILCFAATLLLLVDQSLAGEPAFALSVLATLGIVVFTPPITSVLARGLPRLVAEPIAMCTAAQLTCLPMVISLSEHFSVYSIPLNLLVTPLVPLITVAGILCVLLAPALPVLTGWLLWVPGVPAWGIAELAGWAAGWPGAQRPWPQGTGGVVLAVVITLAVCAAILVLANAASSRLRFGVSALLGGVLLVLCALVLPATLLVRPVAPEWNLAMCDVGQGDALVVNTGGGSGWLIDTGDPGAGVLQCLDLLGIRTLSKVFITHGHEDHMGALPEVLRELPVDEVLVSEGFAEAVQAPLRVLGPGESGAAGPVGFTVLGPDRAMLRGASVNDTSLVLRFDFRAGDGQVSFLTAGDMEAEAMSRLLAQGAPNGISVLKASHHGARNGGTELIERLEPKLLLIPVGAGNSYGHPHPQILKAAEQVGAQVLRTDEQGTVTITFANGRATATRIGVPVR